MQHADFRHTLRQPPRRALACVAALLIVTASRVALACPACQSGRNIEFLKLGAMLSLVPFAVVAMVLWVLRHAPKS